MARIRKKTEIHAGELNLTAMIDVAFQLLSFFVITVQPVDVVTNLKVLTPSPSTKQSNEPVKPILKIKILGDNAFTILDRPVDKAGLDDTLLKLAEIDPDQTVLIQCTLKSSHGKLIEVLDTCSKHKMNNISVVSVES